ncbi:MAG: CHAT domain-containing protein, partial [Actinobacteria bacterium]|nr:CHAT domain-containing protein [Actinomycetota bacterium]
MENLDFEIEIDLASGRDYPVAVVHSPAGEGRGTLHFPYDELALDNHLTKLQLALLNSGRGQRRVVPAEERTVREFGTALFDALFAGEVRTLLDVSRHEARSKGTGLRVKLRCRAPELAALPWEFLFDTEVDEYLCLSRQTPLVRYLEVSTPCEPLKVSLPLRILGVVASPKDLDALDVDREKQRVEKALEHLVAQGKVQLEWLGKPTWRELQQELSRNRWHVVHFVGHGGFDQRRDEGVLAFEDDDGNAHLLGAGDVGLLLGDHDDLRLAVLNACEGARSSARDVFSSTAAVLVRKGTPGVVAMQYEITDLAAIELARSFYDCIASGQPVDTAMSEARKAVRISLPGTLEWGTPVLFMRAPDGQLFDVDADSPRPA